MAVVLVGGGIVLLGRLRSTGLEGAGLVWTGVGWVAFGALPMTWVLRSATVVTEAGVEVRGTFRSRLYPWNEIADIQRHESGGVVLYDRALCQVGLHYLHPNPLGDAFPLELRFLTAQWHSRRGPDWRPRAAEFAQRAEQQAQYAERTRANVKIFLTALFAGLIGFVGSMVLLVVLNSTSASLEENLLEESLPWLMLGMPVVPPLLVVMIALVCRRARMRRR